MKVKTNLKSGGALQEAQDQAESFYNQTDAILNNAGQQIGKIAVVAGDKLGRVWRCALTA
jgi:hypothetical protein